MKKSLFVLALALTPSIALADKPEPPPLPNCEAATVMTAFTGYQGCFGATEWEQPGGQFVSWLDTSFPDGAEWSWLESEKSDASGNGAFTGNPQEVEGDLEFDGTGLTGWNAIAIKANNYVSVYVYKWTTAQKTLPFDMIGTAAKGDERQELSHAELYRGAGEIDECIPGTDPDCTPVPEPSSYALMMAGLAALGVVARRRRNNA